MLYASIFKKALRLDVLSALLLENLAVCGMLLSLLQYVPSLITLIAGDWVLGKSFRRVLIKQINVLKSSQIVLPMSQNFDPNAQMNIRR